MTTAFLLFCAGVTLAECLVLFALLWLGFRLFRGSRRVRTYLYLVLSYPGLFSMGGGTVGFAVPLPLLLGAPVWALTRLGDSSSGVGWIGWWAAPLFATGAGNLSPGWLGLEAAMLGVWLVVGLVVTWVAVRAERARHRAAAE